MNNTNPKPEELEALAKTHPALACLPADLLTKVVAASRVVRYRPGRTIRRAGDSVDWVGFLLEGTVRINQRSDDGGEALMRLLHATAVFGTEEVIAESKATNYVTTLKHSLVMHVEAETFRRLLSFDSGFCHAILVDQAQRMCKNAARYRGTLFQSVEGRLADLLLSYADVVGVPEKGGIRLDVALSHEALSRDLGVSRKTMTRTLAKLKAEGLLLKQRARYVIRDIESMLALGSGPDAFRHSLATTR